MSEQEAWTQFKDALESLKQVHTQVDLEKAKKQVETTKKQLIGASVEFRRQLEARALVTRYEVEMKKLRYKSRTMEHESRVRKIRNRVGQIRDRATSIRARYGMIPNLFPSISKEDERLVCPICFTTNLNWKKIGRKKARKEKSLRDIPWCLLCNRKMVSLPDEEIERLKRLKAEEKVDYKKRVEKNLKRR